MGTDLPNRQSHRLAGFNYAGPGTHFLTICTVNLAYLFGEISNQTMERSLWGEIALNEWNESVRRRPHIVGQTFVVMPNHVHGLVVFAPGEDDSEFDANARDAGMPPKSVGSFLNGYKGAVTKAVRKLTGRPRYELWQSNYHDHVVRNDREFQTIKEYILDNPARWKADKFNLNSDDERM